MMSKHSNRGAKAFSGVSPQGNNIEDGRDNSPKSKLEQAQKKINKK
ncbi:small, acid-soluble spore protein L [Peribacillus sp. B-H-3]